MKKIYIFFVVSLMLFGRISALPDTLYTTDFENGSVGDYVAQADTSGFWTTWSNAPGTNEDAIFSNAQNHTSGGNLSAHTQGNTTDLVLKLGDKVSGKYEISFYYYAINGKGGYFNIQHTETVGVEWAFNCYFGSDGTGKLTADGTDINFYHNTDAWLYVKFIVDLNIDSCWLTIDNDTINSWIFSHQSDGTNGRKQLGAVDFFADALSGQTPEYYIDDVNYIMLEAGAEPPQASVNLTDITTSNYDTTINLVVSNTGELDMYFDVFPVYSAPNAKSDKNTANQSKPIQIKLNPSDFKIQKKYIPVSIDSKNITLSKLDGDIVSSLGWNEPIDVEAAVLFKNTEMIQYVGMKLTSLTIMVGDLPVSGSTYAKVWTGRRKTLSGPIREEINQNFTPSDANSQNTIALNSPVYITGDDLFIGWAFRDPGSSQYCLPMDAGPPTNDANWLHVGESWREMTQSNFGNLGIIGTLTGNTVPTWINLTTSQGTLSGGQDFTINITFDTTGLAPDSTYTAKLIVRSNDLDSGDDYIQIPVSLTIKSKPIITEQPQDTTVCNGGTATFAITATGENLTYQWQKNGVDITGATNPTYTINNVSSSDEGTYVCIVTGDNGITTSNPATLSIYSSIVITEQPTDKNACESSNVTFTVIASNATIYQWQKDGNDIAGETSSELVLNNVSLVDSGIYTCIVSNPCETITSDTAILTVNPLPVITEQPQSQTVCENTTVTMFVTATYATGYEWLMNGEHLFGANSDTLTFNVGTYNSGSYTCIARNLCGYDTSETAILTVNPITTIISQPIDLTDINIGDTVSFEVIAEGSNLTYQWYRDNQEITDANEPFYTISGVDTTDIGSYFVAISGDCGNINSDTVLLTILTDIQVLNEVGITIYPNPNNGKFIIKLDDNSQTYNIKIYNFNGVEIMNDILKGNSNSIDLKNAAPEIYTLLIYNNSISKTVKIIVK